MKSIADVWKNVLERLRGQLSETTIDTWFDEVDVVAMEDSAWHPLTLLQKSHMQTFVRTEYPTHSLLFLTLWARI